MIEKRAYRRFKTKVLITTVYRDKSDRIVTDEAIFSEDISRGGLRIVFPRQLPKGKILDLKVFLFSDPIHLPAHGKVAWSNKKQGLQLTSVDNREKPGEELFWVGVEFIDIDPFTRDRILRWIRKEFDLKEV